MAKERYVGREEIADILGVEPRTITNWVKNHPDFAALTRVRGTSRTFPVQKCRQWKEDRAVADALASFQPPAPDGLAEAERRRAIADAELAELKVAKFKSELVDAGVVGKEIARAFDRVAARLKATPGEFAPQIMQPLTMPEAVAVLRRLVTTSLAGLQHDFGIDDEDQGTDGSGETPTEDVA